ncbi:nucleolar RNA helicase II [Trypanosoma cruzi]|uniref:Nucleolar RNA helicase II n=1 Tax=Trypanosoma cruzi TaxID=5693 RepID=A0A7J6XYC6_TRYCR|nr:nucleolar RNA helicase II [Trypanosoma cruzi]
MGVHAYIQWAHYVCASWDEVRARVHARGHTERVSERRVCVRAVHGSLPHSHAATTAEAAAHATTRRSKRGEVVWETAVLPSLSSVAAVLLRLGTLAATVFFFGWLFLFFDFCCCFFCLIHFVFIFLACLLCLNVVIVIYGGLPSVKIFICCCFSQIFLFFFLVPLFCCVPPFPRQVFLDLILLQRLSVLFLHLLVASFFPGFLFLFRLHFLRYLILLLNSLPVMVLLLLAFAFCRRLLFPQCRHRSFSQYFEDP